MLKIEKQGEEVQLTLQDRNSMFNRDFYQAFGVAAGLHLAGVLLFSIGVISLHGTMSTHAPIEVISEKPFESLVDNDYETEKKVREIFPAPPLAHLHHSILPDLLEVHLPERHPQFSFFASGDSQEWIDLDIPEVNLKKQIMVELMGTLAGLEPTNTDVLDGNSLKGKYKVLFHGYVDTRKGIVFGLNVEQSSGNKDLDRWAELALSNLSVKPDLHGSIRAGYLELTYID